MKTLLKSKMSTYMKAWGFQYQRRRSELDGHLKLWIATFLRFCIGLNSLVKDIFHHKEI